MAKKQQSERLAKQHKTSQGAIGIFGEAAKSHDLAVGEIALLVIEQLKQEFPRLSFRHRASIRKSEINEALKKVDAELGQTLFVENASIIPDGGIVEVKDDHGDWRIVLVSEAKFQGKDIEHIRQGIHVGKRGDQDTMLAGNAIERSHKNIAEIANLMLAENHFPYVLFLAGSNFLTRDVTVEAPDGRTVTLAYNSGRLSRLDRLTAANYGMPINANLCRNRFITHRGRTLMLQAPSIFTRGDGERWQTREMLEISLDIARTSLQLLGRDLSLQISPDNPTPHADEP